jgi:hypothetical protein
MLSNRAKAILINVALLLGCVIQLVRGYRLLIVVVAGLTMFAVGNIVIWMKVRSDRRRRDPSYVGRFALRLPGEKKSTMREFLTARERDEHRMDGPR